MDVATVTGGVGVAGGNVGIFVGAAVADGGVGVETAEVGAEWGVAVAVTFAGEAVGEGPDPHELARTPMTPMETGSRADSAATQLTTGAFG